MSARAIVLGMLLSTGVAGRGQLAGPLDFETPGQLGANFRSSNPAATAFATETSSGGNGYLNVNATSSTPWIGIYDTTPGSSVDASQTFGGTFTVGFDISSANASSSFGIFLFDDANRNGNNLLALFNLDSPLGGGGAEQIRFWRDTTITASGVTNPYTSASFTGTNGSVDAGSNSWISNGATSLAATVDTTSPFTFYHLDFTYNPTAQTLTVASNAFSASLNIPAGDVITNPGIAIRMNDSVINDANSAKFDNFVVVPEPGSLALFGIAGLALAKSRRRAGRAAGD